MKFVNQKMTEDANKTLCVILHYGSVKYTNNCIESITYEKNLDICVADNDPSQSYNPPEHLKDLITVIKTGGGCGFSEGNNIGVNSLLKEVHHSILILNNDTIVTEGALNFLHNVLTSSNVGAVGPCMPYADNTSKIWACGGFINKFNLSIGGLQPESGFPYEVDYLPGAAILCRADLWKKVGGFNENYFLAYEEAELCLEIKKLGFRIMAEPRSCIYHKVGMSSENKPEYYYNSIRNRLIFSKYLYGKNFGIVYGILVTMPTLGSLTFRKSVTKSRLWIKAIFDEITGRKIDRGIFHSIASRFNLF